MAKNIEIKARLAGSEFARVHARAIALIFLELEVVLRKRQSHAEGEVVAERLLGELGVRPDCLVSTAYIDLLERSTTTIGC